MRKKKKEIGVEPRLRGIQSIGEARFLLALFVSFFLFPFSFFFLPATHAQFYGPLANPTNSAGASLVGSSTRALGLATSTIYSTQPNLIFRTLGGANQHILLLPNGKVGIATSTPTSTLTVAGDIFATGNVYGASFVGGTSGAVLAGNVASDVFGSLQGNGNFAFPASLGVATSSKAGLPKELSVYGSGYFSGSVGIGTTNMASDGGLTPKLEIANPLNVNKWVGIGYDNTGDYGFMYAVQNATAWKNLILQPVSGNVGVGTTGPGYKLTVQGTGYFDDQLSARGIALVGSSSVTLAGGNISGVNKLTVTTIDPLYDIRGVRYATYAPSVVGGVYEEYVGQGTLKTKDEGKETKDGAEFEYVVDFDAAPAGSDLWVWRSVVADDLNDVEVLATPRGSRATVWYEVERNRIVFYGDSPAAFSYRLVGRRFDWRNHPTRALDQSEPAGLSIP